MSTSTWVEESSFPGEEAEALRLYQMPEGGIGKEGPSAGTAILSAFVSLFTRTKIDPDIGASGRDKAVVSSGSW